MSEPIKAGDPGLSKHRLEALCDGVFAVVLTLLVLELKPELPLHANNDEVAQALRQLARPLVGYAFSFAITAVFWISHHRKFALLRHTNGLHSALTLAFLFAVTLLPLSVSIYLKSMGTSRGQSLYFGNFTLISLVLLASWLYARHAGLTDPAAPPRSIAALTRRMIVSSSLGVIACATSWTGQTYVLGLMIPLALWVRFRRSAPFAGVTSGPDGG
jgi:uncharacterized membrane protein